jgi:long-chain acyl-CoA synthetase
LNVVDAIRDHATRAGDQPALVSDAGEGVSEVISYAELRRRMDAHADSLRQGGLETGDRCGLRAPQGSTFVELALGVLAAGGCLAPIPDDHRDQVLADFLSRAFLEYLVEPAAQGLSLSRVEPPSRLPAASERAYRALAPAYLRFTSGTTSERKGVLLGHASIDARLAAANRALEVSPADRIIWLLPMAHHFVVSILLYLRNGATLLLPSGSLAGPILEFAARERGSMLYASPIHHRRLANDDSGRALPSLRLAISTADGLEPEVAEAFRARFGQPLVQALGIMEVGLPAMNRVSAEAKPTALGRALPDYEIWLRGDDGKPVVSRGDPNQSGEICIRGPGMLDAYLDPFLPQAELTLKDGFRTGDQGYMDADGDLHLVGRRANRISMSGMKFFCEEVEVALARHPDVRECRVFGRAHPQLGEIPIAEIVVGESVPDRPSLMRHCREFLPSYKVPREFRVVESLERTSSGKLRRGNQRGTR